MPRKIWDVAEPRKLRSALRSTAQFANDAYYREWVTPKQGYTTGTETTTWHLPAFSLADSATSYGRFGFVLPSHWKRGKLRQRVFLAANTNTGALTVNLNYHSRKYSFSDTSKSVTDILDVNEDFDFPDGGGTVVRSIYEPTGWETKIDLDDFEMISVEVERVGGAGTDTVANPLLITAIELTFFPDPTP